VNNYGSFSEVPGDVALKVEIDSPQPEQVGEHLLHLARRPEFRAELEGRAREYAVRVLDPNRCRDLYLAFAERVGPPDRTATGSPPRRVRTTTLSDAVALRHRLTPALEGLQLAGAGPAGAAVFVDALCRLLLRRPADDDEIREAHAALAAGLSRAELLDRVVASPEFAELRLLDELIEDLRRSPGPLRIDRPVGPGTTGRAVQIAWVASRVRGAKRLLGMGLEDSGGIWASALTEAGVAEVHGVDDAPRSARRGVVRDPGSLPYGVGSFDGALCLGAPDGPALAELVRVLRPGGRLVVTAPLEETGGAELGATASLSVEERVVLRRTAQGWVTQDASLPPGAEPSVLCVTLLKGP
jgi:SAM-dependent methyltransferase